MEYLHPNKKTTYPKRKSGKWKIEKLTPKRIHTAISSLHGQMLFTNSFTSDNNLEQRTFTNRSPAKKA